jgi:hypothetical protein
MYKHPETGIELPAAIGPFAQGKVAAYEVTPGQNGVAIPYHTPDAEATVFIRRLLPGSSQTASFFVEESLGVAKAMEKSGKYQKVKIYGFPPDLETDGWKRGAFTAHINNMIAMSFIYCRIKDGHAIKLRITCRNPKNPDWEAFAETVREQVDKAQATP